MISAPVGSKKPARLLAYCGLSGNLRNSPECYLVPRAGIEPARLAAGDFESPASTNFTTWAGLAAHASEHGARRRRRLWPKIRRRASRSLSLRSASSVSVFKRCGKTVRASAGRDSGRIPSRCCAPACARPSALRACCRSPTPARPPRSRASAPVPVRT